MKMPRPPSAEDESDKLVDEFGAKFPALKGIENLSGNAREKILDKKRLYNLACQYGLQEVIRWKPRKVHKIFRFTYSFLRLLIKIQAQNLMTSGVEGVYSQTLFAVIGALALDKGDGLAEEMTRERLLRPLGVS